MVALPHDSPVQLLSAHPLECVQKGSLFHHQDIRPKSLGQSEWLEGHVALSDQFYNHSIK